MGTRDGASTATGQWYATSSFLEDGDFHHVSLAMDNSLTTAGIKFYVDGQALTTVQTSAPQSGFETTAQDSNLGVLVLLMDLDSTLLEINHLEMARLLLLVL